LRTKYYEIRASLRISRQKAGQFLCGLDLLAEGEGFEPPVPFPVQRFSSSTVGFEPFGKFSTLLLFSTGYKSVDLIRSVWDPFVLIVQPLQFHYSLEHRADAKPDLFRRARALTADASFSPSEITQVEERAVMESAYRAKAAEVHLVEQAMMAAIGGHRGRQRDPRGVERMRLDHCERY
jgi:hypothetical protein